MNVYYMVGTIPRNLICVFVFNSYRAPKSLQIVIAAMKLKDAYSLEGKL